MVRNKMPPIHPGEVLSEELDVRGISPAAFARALRVSPSRVTALLKGQRALTADTAVRLARFFGSSAEMWMAIQSAYELRIAEDAICKKATRAIEG